MIMKVRLFFLMLVFFLVGCQQEVATLTLATTTSTHDSGLLEAILPAFETQFNAKIDVVAVGTGQAIALGEAGDADVILVHARSREDAFVADGFGINRREVMYNDFVVVGPPDDPAGIADAPDVATALQQIADSGALFVSRGDDSGTHIREEMLWENAGINVTPNDWYQSIGQGMGATLTFANEEGGYTLTDRGTFIARDGQNGFSLVVLVEGDENLFNPYGVIAINPALHSHVNAALASDFINWLVSPETQQAIGDYKRNGQQLFFPNADPNADPISAVTVTAGEQ
jgi:tungstate transport system substrate-binding protein